MSAGYTLHDDGKAIRCHACGLVSHNSTDVSARYCAGCKAFHDDPVPIPDDLRLLVDAITFDARAMIAQGLEVPPDLIVMRTSDRRCWRPVMDMTDIVGRDAMAGAARVLADEHDADLVILLSEAWGHGGTQEERDALRAKYGSIANIPGREDILMLTIETAQHYWFGKAPITGSGLARRCGEMVYGRAVPVFAERFSRFLATPAERAERAATLAELARCLVDAGMNPDQVVVLCGERRSMFEHMRRMLVRSGLSTVAPSRFASLIKLLRLGK